MLQLWILPTVVSKTLVTIWRFLAFLVVLFDLSVPFSTIQAVASTASVKWLAFLRFSGAFTWGTSVAPVILISYMCFLSASWSLSDILGFLAPPAERRFRNDDTCSA